MSRRISIFVIIAAVLLLALNASPSAPIGALEGTSAPTVIPPRKDGPTTVPPTAIPPTDVPPTAVPPTAVPPTGASATEAAAQTTEQPTKPPEGGKEIPIAPARPQLAASPAVGAPDLELTKTSPSPFKVGVDGIFIFSLRNIGDAATTGNIDVTDALPGGMTFKAATGAEWDCAATAVGSNALSCRYSANGGVLNAATQAGLLTVTVNVPSNAFPNFTNTASVTDLGNEPNTVNNSSTLGPITVQGSPDLTISSQTHTQFYTGVQGSFTIRVQNHGTAPTSGEYHVIDTLPANFTFVATGSYGTGWSCNLSSTGVVDCLSTTVLNAFGSTGTTATDLTIPVLPTVAATGLTNSAVVSGGAEPVALNTDNTSTVTGISVTASPELGIDKTDGVSPDGNFTVGVNATYTLTVTNANGAGTAIAPVVVQDTLPNGLTFVAAGSGGDGFTCVAGAPGVICTRNTNIPANTTANIKIVVAVGAAAVPTVTNTANIVISDSQPTNNSKTITTNVKSVLLALEKTHTPTQLLIGTPATFSFTVTNQTGTNEGNTTGNITITDPLPTGLTFKGNVTGANWSCVQGPPVLCTYDATAGGPLKPGDKTTVTFDVNVTLTTPSTITNTATVAGGGNSGTSNSVSDGPITVLRPDLIVSKTHPGNLAIGVTNDYTLTVTNKGTGDTTSEITVTDTLPATLDLVSATGTGWTCVPAGAKTHPVGDIVCKSPGPATANAAMPIITIRVTPTVSNSYHNLAKVANAEDVDTTNNNADDPTFVEAAPSPDLSIAKAFDPNPFVANANGVYTIKVTNEGVGPTSGSITVKDTLPLSFPIVSAPSTAHWTCTTAGNIVTCNYTGGVVAGGGTQVGEDIVITVKPNTPLGSPFTNHAIVTNVPTGTAETNLVNNTVDVPTPVNPEDAPDLTITKTHPTNFTTTADGTYTLTVTNVGAKPTTGKITVIDNLPTGLTFKSGGGNGTGFTCTAAGQLITCASTTDVLAEKGGSLNFPITVRATSAGKFTNNASVSGGGETNTTNNTANDLTVVTTTNVPDLKVAKIHSPTTFTAGSQGQYTITVTNVGTADTRSTEPTVVTDNLPTGMVFVPTGSGGTGWTCDVSPTNQQTVVCTNLTPIPAGQSPDNITLIVNVANTANGTLQNKVSVSIPTSDPNTANNNATDDTLVSGKADLTLTKSHPGNFQVGVNGTYTLTVKNVSAASTSGQFTVTDTLPDGLVPLSAVGTGFTCARNGQDVTCTRTTPLTGGTSVPITITVDVQSAALGTHTNVAIVSGGGNVAGDNDTGTDPTTVTSGPAPDVTISKAHTGDFVIGATGTFNIVVSNIGTGVASGPTSVQDILPGGLTYVSAAGGGFSCSVTGQVVQCTNNNTITNGAKLAINMVVSVTATSPTTLSNTVTVTQPGDDANPGNSSATDATINIVSAPPPTAANSTIYVNPRSAPADNSSPVNVIVTVRDSTNKVVPNTQVNLGTEGSPTGVTISGSGITDQFGNATFTVTSTTAQNVTFYATLAADATQTHIITPPSGQVRTAQFTTPVNQEAISATRSTLTVSANNPTVGTVITVTVHVVLNSGQPAIGAFVTLFSSVGGPTLTFSNPTTDSSGVATFGIVSSTNLTTVISAQAMTASGLGPVRISQTQTVTWGTGTATVTPTPTGGSGADGSKSSFTTNFVSIPADNVTTATLTATMRNGSSAGLAGKTITVSWNPVLSGMSLTPTTATTDSNGNAAFTVRSVTQGGPVTFTATDTTDGVTIAQTVQITFTAPGTPAVPSTTAAGATATAVPGTAAAAAGLLGAPNDGPSVGIVVPYILCVRSGPGTNYPALGRLKGGTSIVLLGKNPLGTARNFPPRTDCQRGRGGATWFMIQLDNNQTGWVSAFYIRIKRLEFRHLPVVDVPGAAQ